MRSSLIRFVWRISLVLAVSSAFAAVRPAGIFTEGTVLQQREAVRIWGTAASGESVLVSFAGQEKTAVADGQGNWCVELDPMPASSTPATLVVSGSGGSQKTEIGNVLVGEVWLAGGQSNMATTMGAYRKTTRADIAGANDPLLRMVTIPRLEYAGQNSNAPQWKTTTPQNVQGFSSSAYYFAKNLRETLDVPVGIITCAVGATPAEAWMSRETLSGTADLKRILDSYDKYVEQTFVNEEDYLERFEEYEQGMALWHRRKAAKEKPNPRPAEIMGPRNYKRPCGLYETMLSQTIPYTVRGVIWYQGENNANNQAGFHYRTVFRALINEWRNEFRNPELPFLFVQLATFGPASDDAPYWPELRESQSWTEDHVENSGMIVLADGGEIDNIHPHSKDKVGHRLALLARNMVYGEENLFCRGPRLKEMKRVEGRIELTFKDTGSGLVLNPAEDSAFEICGTDGEYVPAKAEEIDGKIIVSAENAGDPQHVRYGWKKWFIPTLFNEEGLPASPFRTDSFPPVTAGRSYLDQL